MTLKIGARTDAEAHTEILLLLRTIRAGLTETRNRFAASGSSYRGVRSLFTSIEKNLARLNVLKTTPRLGQYAKDRQGDQSYDIVAEFTATLTAYEAIQDRILVDLAAIADGNGWYANEKLTKGVGRVDRPFTAGQLADLITDIDTFLATLG